MNIDDVMNEWSKDSEIDILGLGEAAIETGKLQSKYLKILTTNNLLSKKLEIDYKELKQWKKQYLQGDFNNKEDMKKYNLSEPFLKGPVLSINMNDWLSSDKELNTILLKKIMHDEISEFCKAVLKELSNRTYALGSAIKMHIFMNGG